MGLLDFFRKKKKVNKISNQNDIAFSKRSLLNDFIESFHVHPDIKELIWIENGPKRNFFPPENKQDVIKVGDLTITITITGSEEPSLIDIKLIWL